MLFTNKRFMRGVQVVVVAIYVYLPSTSYAQSTSTMKIESAPDAIHQLIQQVLPTHPRFAAAQAELEAVKANLTAAEQAIYNPELELDTEKTDIRTSTIGLSQTIDWGDQRGAKTQIANHQLNAARANFQRQRQQLIRDLLIALIDYRNKTQLSQLSSTRLKTMKDFYRLAQQKHAAGDLNQVELDLAQLAYSETVLNNAQILTSQVNAEQAFYALYGTTSNSGKPALPDLSFDFQAVDIPADLDAFVMTLPQMRIVRANVEARKNTIALRESESSADPTISIRGGKEDQESLAGLTLTIPLNVRNTFSAEIESARKEYVQAEQLAQQAFHNLRSDIASSTRQYQLTQNAWQQWQSSGQVSVNRQLKLLKRLWRAGDLSTTDYLVQIKQNLDTQSAGIELQTILWSSWLNWLETTAQIESWLQLNTIRNQ